MPTSILLDCDPGHDDAIALLLAHGNPVVVDALQRTGEPA